MPITYTGTNWFDGNSILAIVGDNAVGTLTIDGASVLSLNGPAQSPPYSSFLQVGNGATGDGTITIDGGGSRLELFGNGDDQGGMHIGSEGTGVVNIINSGQLSLSETPTAGSFMALTIGRTGAADGTLNVVEGLASISAWGAIVNVGRDGATGNLQLGTNGLLEVMGVDSANLRIGRDSGTGTFTSASASVVVEADNFAEFEIGRSGTGTATITGTMSINATVDEARLAVGFDSGNGAGTGTLTIETGGAVTQNGQNNATSSIGQGAGSTGTVNVTGSSALNQVAINNNAGFDIGRDGGTGALNVDGSGISVSAGNIAFLNLGENGGDGSATLSNSAALSLSSSSGSFVDAGWGGTGTISVDGTSMIALNSTGGDSVFNVGLDAGGTGTLTVSNGSSIGVSSGTANAGFQVGRDSAGASTASFDGSTITLSAALGDTFTNIGAFGGTGTLNLNNASAYSANALGGAFMETGRDGTGTVNIDNSSLSLLGDDGNAAFNFGRGSSGIGTATITNASSVSLSSSANAFANIGWDGGTGDVSLDSSGMVIVSVDADAGVEIGTNGGDGSLTLTGTSTVSINGTASGSTAGMSVGRNGGSGDLNVGAGGQVLVGAVGGGETYLDVGRDGGAVGTVALQSATFNMQGSDDAFVNIGRNGTGVFTADGSTIDLSGTNDESSGNIGRGVGADGTLTLTGGSSLTFQSSGTTSTTSNPFPGSYVSVGRENGSGVVTVDNSNYTQTAQMEAGLNVGRGGGTGTFNVVNGGSASLSAAESNAFVNVGREGGQGTINVIGGSTFIAESQDGSAFLNIGRNGGTGILNIDGSNVDLTGNGSSGSADVRLGMDFGIFDNPPNPQPGGDGTLILDNGSILTLAAYETTIQVGYTPTEKGTLQVLGGSTINMNPVSTDNFDNRFTVGSSADATQSSTAEIIGAGSAVNNSGGATIVGYFKQNELDLAVGNGWMIIDQGGALTTGLMDVASGGHLLLGDSTTTLDDPQQGSIFVTQGGKLELLPTGTATVNGDVTVDAGSILEFNIASDGSSAGHMHVNGFFNVNNGALFTIEGTGSSVLAGDRHLFLSSNNPLNIGTVTTELVGFDLNFAYGGYFVEAPVGNTVEFFAVNNGDGTGSRHFDLSISSELIVFEYDLTLQDGRFGIGTEFDLASEYGTINRITGVTGTGQNDQFALEGAGAFAISGGGGTNDTVNLTGNQADYAVNTAGATTTVAGLGLTLTLDGVETLVFADGSQSINVPNGAPVATVEDQSVAPLGWLLLADIMTVNDPDGDTPTFYQLWDSDGGNNWFISGTGFVDASAGHWVAAADLGSIWLQGDASPSTQSLFVQAFEPQGGVGPWDGFTLTTASSNTPPVVTIGDQTVEPLQWVPLSTVLAVSDAEGDAITLYEVYDDTGGNNWWVAGQGLVDATAGYQTANLSDIWFQGDAAASAQTLSVRAFDGTDWSALEMFTLTTQAPPNEPPVATVADQTVVPGAWVQLETVLTVTDANGDAPAWYQVRDTQGEDNWWVGGEGFVDASAGYWVAAADLSNVWFRGDSAASTQTLSVLAFDTEAGPWGDFILTTQAPAQEPPVAMVDDQTLSPGGWAQLSQILTVTDANGDTPAWYQVRDTEGGDNWWIAGIGNVDASAGYWIAAGDLDNVWLQGDASASTQTLSVLAFDTAPGPWDDFVLTTT